MKSIQLWQPWDRGFPHLYDVTAKLHTSSGDALRHELFGFRSIRVDQNLNWYINGVPYFPRGSNYLPSQWLSETLFPEVAAAPLHPFRHHSIKPEASSWFDKDVSLAKQANLNLLRVHAHVLPSSFYQTCDRAGLLVWQDFPLQWGYADDPGFHQEAIRQANAMVRMLYNYPSIGVWCCHNESPCEAPWMANMAGGRFDPAHNRELDIRLEQAIRKIDLSRYVHRNSGTGDGHVYPGWYVGHWQDYLALPGAPLVTEYGAQGLPGRESIQRMLPELGSDSGFASLVLFKNWLDSQKQISPGFKQLIRIGTRLYLWVERLKLTLIQDWMKSWGIKLERSVYKNIPSNDQTPPDYRLAREIWEKWRFHDFQPAETFDNGISLGGSMDEFISNSQAYQAHLIQYATEIYRRSRSCPQNRQIPVTVTGVVQFDFTDPWPAVTWSVLDYWREPKPSYTALQNSMQPVLPSFLIPPEVKSGKAALLSFRVVNDTIKEYPDAVCEWRLKSRINEIASATFPVHIPANGISEDIKLTLPSLFPGQYHLAVNLVAGSQVLGKNEYPITVEGIPGGTL